MHVYDGSLLGGVRWSAPGRGGWCRTRPRGASGAQRALLGGAPAIGTSIRVRARPAVALREAKRGDLESDRGADPGALARAGQRARIVRGSGRSSWRRPAALLAFNAARLPLDDRGAARAGAAGRSPHESPAVFGGLARRRCGRSAGRAGERRRAGCPTSIRPQRPSCSTRPAGPTASPRTASATMRQQLRLVMIGSEKPAQHDASVAAGQARARLLRRGGARIGVVIDVKTGGEAWLDKRLTAVRTTWSSYRGVRWSTRTRRGDGACSAVAGGSIGRSMRWRQRGIRRARQAGPRAGGGAGRDLAGGRHVADAPQG